tara:strand:- start:69 stop:422 length:354 start_codon:yes stop_codon:yes gene_type:complete
MKGVKKTIYLISIILFLSNYQICDFFYYNNEIKDIQKWWGLRSNITSITIMLVFYASLIDSKGVLKLILSIGVGFCFSDVIDRIFFSILDFNYKDTLMIILTICISLYKYLDERPHK